MKSRPGSLGSLAPGSLDPGSVREPGTCGETDQKRRSRSRISRVMRFKVKIKI